MSSQQRNHALAERSPTTAATIGTTDITTTDFTFQLERLFTENVYLNETWHDSKFLNTSETKEIQPTWRLKERMKTSGVALVVCLNLGTDPPDVVKPVPCARKECWIDPVGSKMKNLESIGHELQHQYEKWQSKAKYKQCLDPTSEDLRRVCINLRKTARNDRLLLHYNGHGVPLPTKNGELWVFGKHYTHYMPVAIFELRAWLGEPAIYVLDCSHAGTLLSHFIDPQQLNSSFQFSNELQTGNLDLSNTTATTASGSSHTAAFGTAYNGTGDPGVYGNNNASKCQTTDGDPKAKAISEFYSEMEGPVIVLAACRANEILPLNPLYPADVFTSCLTTPLTIALRWFILQNPYSMDHVSPDWSENIPGKDNDRKTPRGELNWIFTAITDTIAWTTLPSATFQKMFRQDLLVASLFRNFLLAKRIMKSLNCSPQSWPPLPDSSSHPLWHAWDLATEACISHVLYMQKGTMMIDPKNNIPLARNNDGTGSGASAARTLAPDGNLTIVSQSAFFTDNLTAFEIWLDFGGQSTTEIPLHLPVLLQVLLSQTHRLHALLLLKRYLSMGPSAVNLALLVGIFPYILKLLQSPSAEVKQVLVCIWASVLGFDPSCRMELVRDKSQGYFIQYLGGKDHPDEERCMCAFVLSEFCSEYREGQQTCLQQGLHRTCTSVLDQVLTCPLLKRWVCLCLFKYCEDFGWARYVCLAENTHLQLYPLLEDPEPTVRACAILAIGEMFGASDPGLNSDGVKSDRESIESAHDQKYQLRLTEQELAMQILESCSDGSVVVRKEALTALSKFCSLPAHTAILRIVSNAAKYRSIDPIKPWKVSAEDTQNITEKVVQEMNGMSNARMYDLSMNPDEIFQQQQPSQEKSTSRSLTEPSIDDEQPPRIEGDLRDPFEAAGDGGAKLENVDGAESSSENKVEPSKTQSRIPLMAAGYVGLLLALYEIQGKDPHIEIRCMTVHIINYINQTNIGVSTDSMDPTKPPQPPAEGTVPIPSSIGGPIPTTPTRNRTGSGSNAPPLSPLGIAGLMSRSPSQRLQGSLGKADIRSFPFSNDVNIPLSKSGPSYQQKDDINDGIFGQVPQGSASLLQSNLYSSFRKIFLEPIDKYNSKNDPLSEEGGMEAYRKGRLDEVRLSEKRLRAMSQKDNFSSSETSNDFVPDTSLYDNPVVQFDKNGDNADKDKATKDIKFEQRVIINIDNADITSHVMFHSFLDILAISDGVNVGIWSLNNGSRVMQLNRPCDPIYDSNLESKNKLEERKKRGGSFSLTGSSGTALPKQSPESKKKEKSTGLRITSMTWINESYDALLCLGADNGSVTVWRDNSVSDRISESTSRPSSIRGSNFNSTDTTSETSTKAASFFALPDVAETTRGSGLVMSWQQQNGTLVAGGNSNTIRLWDLKREQCVRVFATGLETCTTTLASKAVSPLDSKQGNNNSDSDDSALSWTFAGFADGSIGVFDERVQGTGRVAIAREHSAWIVAAHFRPDVSEVITGSVRGSVKFWDLRTMRSFKTLEVHKSPLTALAVHPSAPIMATGSHAQFIKILTLGGEQLGGILKYHDGFLGQRIGPVSCLAFHPTKVLLAAGATDSIVSIYGTQSFGT
jgi:WD40 repeat protein